MVTRGNAKIFKPKSFVHTTTNSSTTKSSTSELTYVKEALKDENWTTTMYEDLIALAKNKTWDLVPFSLNMSVVSNRWVFHLKHNVDCSI